MEKTNFKNKFNQESAQQILYRTLLVRIVEEEIVERYGKPGDRQEMRCPVHLSIGQEAAAGGACYHLTNDDRAFSTHRCHAHYLAKGGSVDKMALELHGKLGGCLDGRGGSMHLMDDDVGMMASVPIVSSSIPLAVGAALSDKIDENKNVSLAFFGDASTEEGVFHESVNFASLKELPVIFVCENNLYSVYTHIDDRQPNRDLSEFGNAHGLKTIKVDGNDVFAVADAFKDIVCRAREERKPSLVVMDTYRWREHCGVNYDDHLGYRDANELPSWQKRDPVNLAIEAVKDAALISEEQISNMKISIQTQVSESFDMAVDAPLPNPELASRFVYA